MFLTVFPIWKNFLHLVWCSLRAPSSQSRQRRRALVYLMKSALWTPLYIAGWYLDEILFPDYRKERISSPVFILSQPRSGTTTVHRTLAADHESFFAVKHIEWRLPFVWLHKLVGWFGLSKWLDQLPYWSEGTRGSAHEMHPMLLGSFEEDGVLFEERFFAHPFILTRFPFRGVCREQFSPTREAHVDRLVDIHHRVLQKVKFLRGGGELRYLGKEVACIDLGFFWAKRYPDATFVTIGRRSSVVVPSYLRLMRESVRSKTGADPVELPWFAEWLEANLRVIAENAERQVKLFTEVLPGNRVVACSFDKLFAHPENTFEQLANLLGSKILVEIGHHGSAVEDPTDAFSELDLTRFAHYDRWVRQIL